MAITLGNNLLTVDTGSLGFKSNNANFGAGGGYLTTTDPNQFILCAGMEWTGNTGTFIARSTSASYVNNDTGLVAIGCVDGITIGATVNFAAMEKVRIAPSSASGIVYVGTTGGDGILNLTRIPSNTGTEDGALVCLNNDQRFTIQNFYQFGNTQYCILASTNANYTNLNPIFLRCNTLWHAATGGNNYLVTTTGGNTSDISIKTNIKKLTSSLEKLCLINGYEFDFTEEYKKEYKDETFKKHQIGIIAQEVEQQFPEVVNQAGEYKKVNYEKLVAPIIEAIKELKLEIDILKNNKI